VEDQALKYVGVLMRQVLLNIHHGYEAMIKRFGVTQETLDAWTDLIDEGTPSSFDLSPHFKLFY
jgi:hypothetical protein